MNPGDRVRLRFPIHPFEHRVATVTEIDPQPDGLHGDRLRLRFPTGQRMWCLTDETTPHDAKTEQATIAHALAVAYQHLTSIETIAEDADDELADMITVTVEYLNDVTYGCLGISLAEHADVAAPVDQARS